MPLPRVLSEIYQANLERRSWVARLNEAPETPAADALKDDPQEQALVRDLQNRISYGLALINRRFPDLGVILSKLNVRIVNSNDPIVNTMAVDPVGNLYINPKFSKELNEGEFYGVLAHEALHHANGTFWRKKDRDHTLWNIATDSIMNWALAREGVPLPKVGIIPDINTGKFVFKELQGKLKKDHIMVLDPKGEPYSAEEIYDQLVDVV